ncbi:MAG TPA: tetratricopeptide repeat protein [Armatimonadota bacterium]|nr:tetratricopeptide repeat protein [Armatimonadota bacterium]
MSAETLPLADPFDASTPEEEEELRRLARAVELAEGFTLLFARCNQEDQRARLSAELRRQLPGRVLQEIHLTEPVPHLLDELRTRLQDPSPDAVLVSGLGYSLPKAAEAHRAPVVLNLNAARNSFPTAVSCPLVLWIPEYALAAISLGAPDFFSVRSGVYYFAVKPRDTAAHVDRLTEGEVWTADNLPVLEKLERVQAIEALLADYQSLPEAQRDLRTEIRLHTRLGVLLKRFGKYSVAALHHQWALAIAERTGDVEASMIALNNLGNVYLDQGRWGEAEACYWQRLNGKQEPDDRASESQILNNIGIVYRHQGRWAEAEACFQKSLTIRGQPGGWEEAAALNNLGLLYRQLGRWMEAEAAYQRGLAISRELNDRAGEASMLNNLSIIYREQGRWEEARVCCEQSLPVIRELGDRVGEGRIIGNWARLQAAQGDLVGALDLGQETLRVLAATEAEAAKEQTRNQIAEWEAQLAEGALGPGKS